MCVLLLSVEFPRIKNKDTSMMSFTKLKQFYHLVEVILLQLNDKETHWNASIICCQYIAYCLGPLLTATIHLACVANIQGAHLKFSMCSICREWLNGVFSQQLITELKGNIPPNNSSMFTMWPFLIASICFHCSPQQTWALGAHKPDL